MDDELITDFLTETNESLSELDTSLVSLEQNPDDKELLSQIFRVMHTIKGTSGFLDLPRLGSVAHYTEDLLGLFRDGDLSPTTDNISLIFESLDRIKSIIEAIEATGKEPDGDDSELTSRLSKACAGSEESSDAPDEDSESKTAAEDPAGSDQEEESFSPPPVPMDDDTIGNEAPGNNDIPIAAQSLRVNIDVLENLMTLVSELVLTRNQIMQIARSQKDNEISGSLQRLNHIVSDLQEGVMKTRMQPVGNAWSKIPRIIRDIANDLDKKIELEMLGKETELDRQVLEMIRDPLTHMVRNSADHGIETPEERVAAGKKEQGKIRLNSYHEGGHIIIEISDDGRGLSTEKIKNKILENNLAREEDIANLSDQQIQQYIFAPGFSTAEQITSVSGRGVGMDVVRTNIEKIGGSIEMNSTEGKGTIFTIKIPLTLAIVSSLIVGIENERFAIPQLDVTELVMVAEGDEKQIEMINNTPVYRLRERILPLICLRSLMGFPPAEENSKEPCYIIVLHIGTYSFGVIVEKVFDTEEIVVKPVSNLLSDLPVFSGNTILGDGQVIMILDTAGLLKASGIADATANYQDEQNAKDAAKENEVETPLLLFQSANDDLKAVILDHVDRLEEIQLEDIELAGGQRVVQYGDTLMPLKVCSTDEELPATGRRPVIVFKNGEEPTGLIVERILDISSHRGDFQIKSEGALYGSAIIQGKSTDIINLFHDSEPPGSEKASKPNGYDQNSNPQGIQDMEQLQEAAE